MHDKNLKFPTHKSTVMIIKRGVSIQSYFDIVSQSGYSIVCCFLTRKKCMRPWSCPKSSQDNPRNIYTLVVASIVQCYPLRCWIFIITNHHPKLKQLNVLQINDIFPTKFKDRVFVVFHDKTHTFNFISVPFYHTNEIIFFF